MTDNRTLDLPIHYAELEGVYAKISGPGIGAVAVAAAESGEGVSTLCRALAYRAAAAGRRTLLVDLNMARPTLERSHGLCWAPCDGSDAKAMIAAPRDNLTFLPAPGDVEGAWSFREAGAMERCLKRWRERFDCILLDTSPLNRRNKGNIPADLACAASDAAVMVVLAGRTAEGAVVEARGRLEAVEANVIGAVLNDRFAPGLAVELCRETHRLDRILPGLMKKARAAIRRSPLINQDI